MRKPPGPEAFTTLGPSRGLNMSRGGDVTADELGEVEEMRERERERERMTLAGLPMIQLF